LPFLLVILEGDLLLHLQLSVLYLPIAEQIKKP
jgi:hypothetical protein